MTNETLRVLASFRDGVAGADDATAERVYRRITEAAGGGGLQRPARWRAPRRRLVIAVAVAALAAVLAAVALADSKGWWFLGSGGLPPPTHEPGVVREGEWDGHRWQLIAYRTSAGLCYSMTPIGSETNGRGAATGCAAISGVPRTVGTESPDLTITWLGSGGSAELPPYVIGPVVGRAEQVEIELRNGQVLRVPTFPAPESVGPVRFYATPLPADVVAAVAPGERVSLVRRLAGFDQNGNLVACLVPADPLPTPLSSCRQP